MLLLEPARTPWDLHFEIAGIPVRVHPLFWLMGLLIGGAAGTEVGLGATGLFIGIGVVFVSILVHELGHAFTMRYYGEQAHVVLYMMGGLAIPGGDNVWSTGYHQRGRSSREQIIISAAGPIAGFLLAGIVVAIVYMIGGRVAFAFAGFLPGVFMVPSPGMAISKTAFFTIQLMLWVNIYWGFLNLLPVYPLDGGQIAREIFILKNPYEGIGQSLWLSTIVGGGVAVYGLMSGSLFMAVMFGSLAFSSWQMLQSMGGGGRRPW